MLSRECEMESQVSDIYQVCSTPCPRQKRLDPPSSVPPTMRINSHTHSINSSRHRIFIVSQARCLRWGNGRITRHTARKVKFNLRLAEEMLLDIQYIIHRRSKQCSDINALNHGTILVAAIRDHVD